MPALQNAYCCAELRTGVGLIGWIGTIVTSLILFYFCNNLHHGYVIETTFTPNLYQFKTDFSIWEVIIVLLKWIYYFCASFLLILAALKKKQTLLLPWLIVAIVDIIVISYYVSYMGFADKPFAVFIIYLTILFTLLYHWLIVYSFYQERENASLIKNRNYTSMNRY